MFMNRVVGPDLGEDMTSAQEIVAWAITILYFFVRRRGTVYLEKLNIDGYVYLVSRDQPNYGYLSM